MIDKFHLFYKTALHIYKPLFRTHAFYIYFLVLIFLNVFTSCIKKEKPVIVENSKIIKTKDSTAVEKTKTTHHKPQPFSLGASNFQNYIGYLNNRRIGLVVNHTATIQQKHLVDTLLDLNINIKKIFVPEHGFRGKADAGEHLSNSVDKRTGISLISLYGKNDKKPKAKDLQDVDVMIFDIQDVGVRFYTYISTMHYVMEACAENNIPLIILDRPNPNGRFIDGPVRQKDLNLL